MSEAESDWAVGCRFARRRRGKRPALATAAAAMLLVGLTAFLLRDRLLVEWHLWRLQTGDEAARIQAAERLGELRAVRAAPRLLQQLGADAVANWRARENRWCTQAPLDLNEGLSAAGRAAKNALLRVGALAAPHILRAILGEKDDLVALHWTSTLLEIRGVRSLVNAAAALRRLRDDPVESDDTRRLAAMVLEKRYRY